MKAIHNIDQKLEYLKSVGNYKLKYNFESNSQPKTIGVCSAVVGNYKLKYNFESNSQRETTTVTKTFGWEL
ncbi:hypothetical protein SAMN05444372_10281 [Flavobacterium micromati]|uniref:Uncharacterized protein n=1 Tax=Flavobacterium micromati TaxID=229205 RepID=A0A1M5GNY0_9FLAO|nr:hypothetical protein SAMN05444372_10281 [Flavobacterium micromati]